MKRHTFAELMSLSGESLRANALERAGNVDALGILSAGV